MGKKNHDRHARDFANLRESTDKHASLPNRVAYLEQELGDSADKHAKTIDELKRSHEKHARDVADLRGAQSHHATFEDRVAILEKEMGDSSEKHIGLAKDTQARHSSVEKRLQLIE